VTTPDCHAGDLSPGYPAASTGRSQEKIVLDFMARGRDQIQSILWINAAQVMLFRYTNLVLMTDKKTLDTSSSGLLHRQAKPTRLHDRDWSSFRQGKPTFKRLA
jgi:hypothetical protein